MPYYRRWYYWGDPQPAGAGEAGDENGPQPSVRAPELRSASDHECHDGGAELPVGCDLAQGPWVPGGDLVQSRCSPHGPRYPLRSRKNPMRGSDG